MKADKLGSLSSKQSHSAKELFALPLHSSVALLTAEDEEDEDISLFCFFAAFLYDYSGFITSHYPGREKRRASSSPRREEEVNENYCRRSFWQATASRMFGN
jgi:hypothetical protein